MTDLVLLRIGRDDDTMTQGVLLKDGIAFAVTLERPWLNNEQERSCIPGGTYTCKRIKSPKFGETFEITDVPGRTHILFHKLNEVGQTLGCVGVAEKFVGLGIGESAEGFNELMAKFKDRDSFILSVIDVNKYLPTT
jgi:hypothetical protein